jgi:hypothetical protein
MITLDNEIIEQQVEGLVKLLSSSNKPCLLKSWRVWKSQVDGLGINWRGARCPMGRNRSMVLAVSVLALLHVDRFGSDKSALASQEPSRDCSD